MARDLEHPEITKIMQTGYPSWAQDEDIRCDECGRVIYDTEDIYECSTHEVICEDCLKMLHKKYM